MLEKTPAAVGHALEGVRAGFEKTFWADPEALGPNNIQVTSTAFADGSLIPVRFTQDGAKISPPLAVSGAPAAAGAVILVVEDPDSPTPAPFVHLLAQSSVGEIAFAEGAFVAPVRANGLIVGHNTMGKAGWLPPDPPTGHGPHQYLFQVFALDHAPDLETGAEKHDFQKAVRGHVLARGKMTGVYQRPG